MCNKISQMYKSSVICNFHQIYIWKLLHWYMNLKRAFVSVLFICKPPCICVQTFETLLTRLRFTNAFFLKADRLQPIRCLTALQPITCVPPHEGFLADVITARNGSRVQPMGAAMTDNYFSQRFSVSGCLATARLTVAAKLALNN